MSRKKSWLPILWGAGIGVAAASYAWGTSVRAGLVAGSKIIFTLVIPMIAFLLCLAFSLGSAGGNEDPPARS